MRMTFLSKTIIIILILQNFIVRAEYYEYTQSSVSTTDKTLFANFNKNIILLKNIKKILFKKKDIGTCECNFIKGKCEFGCCCDTDDCCEGELTCVL